MEGENDQDLNHNYSSHQVSNHCHYFGQTYYCSPVWLNDALSHVNWNRMRSQHYRALRAAFGDYKCKMSRDLLNQLSARATPRQWSYYITAKTAIGLILKSDTRLAEETLI